MGAKVAFGKLVMLLGAVECAATQTVHFADSAALE